MKGPARALVLAAFAAALVHPASAAAAERFMPADAAFVVANVRQAVPDVELRTLIARWRAQPGDAASVALASAFIDHARSLREPMYMGRAEAVLAAAVARPDASAGARRLYAETLQYRHDFTAAEALLDQLLTADPRDGAARLQRASIRLVRGDFSAARADCARLVAGGGAAQTAALACLAEALAGGGQLPQARALLGAVPRPDGVDATSMAYLLTIRAELNERAQATGAALADYRAALALNPGDDATRASLADALLARGALAEARAALAVPKPGLALLVRAVACAPTSERRGLAAQAAAWLELEKARGDAPHLREAAMLALSRRDATTALRAAEANFRVQRELPDVRVLARAASMAHDEAARRRLGEWLRQTGFRDVVTENILAGAARS